MSASGNTSTLTLSQLSDLALGTPEVGAVNFNCLHTLINGMLQKLQIAETKVNIPEYQHRLLTVKPDNDQESGIFSVHGDDHTDGAVTAGGLADRNKNKTRTKQSLTAYHALETRMSQIEEEVKSLSKLPSNAELFKRTGQKEEAQPVSDMWSIMKLQKQVEANEQGIGKLMSLIEDMMKQLSDIKTEQLKLRADLSGLEAIASDLQRKIGGLDELDNFVTWEGLEKSLKGLKDTLDTFQAKPTIHVTAQTDKVQTVDRPVSAQSSRPGSGRGPSPELQALLERLGQLTERFDALTTQVQGMNAQVEQLWEKKADKDALAALSVPSDLLAHIAQLKSDFEKLFDDRKENEAALAKLRETLLQLQEDVAQLMSRSRELEEDSITNQKHIEALYELTKDLKECKADKEYVDVELEGKADKKLLDGKVSRQLFESTCEELNRLISEMLEKLAGHESEWQKAYAQLTTDLDGKLDRLELDPLREYLERRIKLLDKRTQRMNADANIDDEAAILRRQLSTRFNCLSCDRSVDMMTNVPVQSLPEVVGLVAKPSARPYQVYELDQLRQHARNYGQPDVTSDYYVRRSCGGSHTLTYPHKRTTSVPPGYVETRMDPEGAYSHREEAEVKGTDGRIYKTYESKKDPKMSMSKQIAQLARAQSRPSSSPGGRPSSAQVSRASRPLSSRAGSRPKSAVTPKKLSSSEAVDSSVAASEREASPRTDCMVIPSAE